MICRVYHWLLARSAHTRTKIISRWAAKKTKNVNKRRRREMRSADCSGRRMNETDGGSRPG